MGVDMVGHFEGLQAVISHINDQPNREAQVTACMRFMLAMVKLDTGQMSDAIQEAFLTHEAQLGK